MYNFGSHPNLPIPISYNPTIGIVYKVFDLDCRASILECAKLSIERLCGVVIGGLHLKLGRDNLEAKLKPSNCFGLDFFLKTFMKKEEKEKEKIHFITMC